MPEVTDEEIIKELDALKVVLPNLLELLPESIESIEDGVIDGSCYGSCFYHTLVPYGSFSDAENIACRVKRLLHIERLSIYTPIERLVSHVSYGDVSDYPELAQLHRVLTQYIQQYKQDGEDREEGGQEQHVSV